MSLRRIAVATVLLAILPSLRADEGDVHLFAGNPSGAFADKEKPDNYLLRKRQYVVSYNNSKGTPNWTSWQLNKSWLGRTRRGNPFAPDTSLPSGFFVVRPTDYRGSGFDRGHMCPAADRSVSATDMDSTFLMTNMVPQAPNLNRKTWEKLEEYARSQAREREVDLYITAGPAGKGGVGSDGERTHLNAKGGKIVVPSKCWKVVLVVPAGTTDPKKVTAEAARVFSVIMPNIQAIETDWRDYAVTVREVEKLTGFNFFSALPADVAKELKDRKSQTRASSTTAEKEKPKKGEKGEPTGVLAKFEKRCVVANKATKIYHVEGGAGYEKAKTSKNVIFFKTVKDAEQSGYRAAKR
jgi:endonuclease G